MEKISKSTSGFSYHSISDHFQLGINRVGIDKFQEQIRFISTLKNKFLSFDDGYESFFLNAFETILEYQVPSIVFPITSVIGHRNSWDVNFFINGESHMDSSQIREIYSNDISVGSHGHSHRSLVFMDDDEIRYELITSKNIIEDIIQASIDSFSPPFGHVNENIINIAYDLGYRRIFTYKHVAKKLKDIPNDFHVFDTSPIYRIDTINSLDKKNRNILYEGVKENIISSFSNLTVIVKELL